MNRRKNLRGSWNRIFAGTELGKIPLVLLEEGMDIKVIKGNGKSISTSWDKVVADSELDKMHPAIFGKGTAKHG